MIDWLSRFVTGGVIPLWLVVVVLAALVVIVAAGVMAVRALECARRDGLASGQPGDEERIGRLLGQVAMVRGRVASDYTPTAASAPKWQQVGNTTPWTNRKTPGGETAEIGLSQAASATDRNEPQTPRLTHNEGVRGSC